jgi:hypothetical protein
MTAVSAQAHTPMTGQTYDYDPQDELILQEHIQQLQTNG